MILSATCKAWRSFVTKPGYPDDIDHVCEWDDEEDRDEFGWGPDDEVEIASVSGGPIVSGDRS